MDQFLELASYDWMLSEPQGKMSGQSTDHRETRRVLFCRAGLPVADGLNSISEINIRELHQPAQQAGGDGLHEQLPAPGQVHHEPPPG